MSTIIAISRNEVRQLRRDLAVVIVVCFIPLLLIGFVQPLFEAVLVGQGLSNDAGAQLAVPSMAVFFAFFLVGDVGHAFYKESMWNTGLRLRSSGMSTFQLFVGKVAPLLLLTLVQQWLIFGASTVFYGFRFGTAIAGVMLVSAAFASTLMALGVMVVSLSRSVKEVAAFQIIGTMVLGGLGGALTPIDLLPGWVQVLAKATPTYWAIAAYRRLFLEDGGLTDVLGPVAALLGIAIVAATIAARRFNANDGGRRFA